MRIRAGVLLCCMAAAGARGQEVNPVRPEAAKLLRQRAYCVRIAEEAATTLLGRAREVEGGLRFADGDASVYSGDAGVALLFIGLLRAKGEAKWADAARRTLSGARGRAGADAGLYTGLAGVGQAWLDLHRVAGDPKALEEARACADALERAQRNRCTDVISGEAGIGIFLLNLHAVSGAEADLAAARRCGDWLATRALRVEGTASWRVGADGASRVYTGFSHGAAGIGYFLLELGHATGDARFTDLATEAAAFVVRHARPEGADGWEWFRTVPPIPDEELRIQWCHGAPGNGLFFAALVRRLGRDGDRAALARCVATTRRRGRTARAGGCQCHGAAGNAELLLEAYALGGDEALLAEARRTGSALLVPRDGGFALETRYGPSYMTGLAGIGHFFLRLADPRGTPLPLMVGAGNP